MSKPVPVVLQIQADALDPSVSTVDLLRRAQVASSKLGVGSAASWMDHETNGYDRSAAEDLPQYRVVAGHPQFFNPVRGWCPLLTDDEWLRGDMSTSRLFQPLGELERLAEDEQGGLIRLTHDHKLNGQIMAQIGFATQTGVAVPRTTIWGVVEKVRTIILDWSLELERTGVLGEGMIFTLNEKTKALTVTNNYFAQNIGVAGNVEGGSTVQNNQVTGAALDLEAVRSLLQQMQQLAPMLPQDVRAEVEADAQELQAEAAEPQPDQGGCASCWGPSARPAKERAATSSPPA